MGTKNQMVESRLMTISTKDGLLLFSMESWLFGSWKAYNAGASGFSLVPGDYVLTIGESRFIPTYDE